MERRSIHPKLLGLIWVLVALAIGGLFSAGLPFFVRLIPWSVEQRIAASVPILESFSACGQRPGSRGSLALQEVISRLAPKPDFPLSVTVVRGREVNAFAFLGGQIFVYEELLTQAGSPDELAGVLAHEMEHVSRRHILQGALVKLITAWGLNAETARMILDLHFSRAQEAEADELGLKRLQAAEIDTAGFGRFFDRLAAMGTVPELLSDHPSSAGRAELARRLRTAHPRPLLSATQWKDLRNICQEIP